MLILFKVNKKQEKMQTITGIEVMADEGEKRTSGKPVPPRQMKFVKAYVANGGNARSAAISAGYSYKSASEIGAALVQRKKIRELIELESLEWKERGSVTEAWIIDRLKTEATLSASEGGSSSARVAALKILGQTQGMLIDRKHITRGSSYENMTLEQLKQEEAKLLQQLDSLQAIDAEVEVKEPAQIVNTIIDGGEENHKITLGE